ncbi:STAS domain-containing protein [Peribacillus glennii]|uniref:STAS domain-containing protein n=1 Tax=Peribacillus glennii TaxID=2303991 RepID=A0A372LF42_9BACI|nr:STAS domain-containing protein [Peribacillus glennii]RFU64908.1 STAS domain-containing protein [Peribacillus glennii]
MSADSKKNINEDDFGSKIDSLIYNGEATVIENLQIILEGFMATMEELLGFEHSEAFLEASGFRTGKMMAKKIHTGQGVQEILKTLARIYANGGWGRIEFEHLSEEKKMVILKLDNKRETKINFALSDEHTLRPIFMAAHLAGLFSVLFNEDMWYRFSERHVAGLGYSVIEIFRSSSGPADNLSSRVRTKEQEQIKQLKSMVEEKKHELTNTIRELSSPVIPVLDHIVVIPLFGKFEDSLASQLTEKILAGVIGFETKYLLLDLTAVRELDEFTPAVLRNITQAVNLLGAETFLVGISPAVSMGMVESKVDIQRFKCFNTLKHALTYTLSIEGLEIARRR